MIGVFLMEDSIDFYSDVAVIVYVLIQIGKIILPLL